MAYGTMRRGASSSSLQMRRSQDRFSPFSVFGKTVLCKEKKGVNGVFVRDQDCRLRCNPSHAASSHTHMHARIHTLQHNLNTDVYAKNYRRNCNKNKSIFSVL